METKKPTSRTVDKWTRSPEEIFKEHGLTIKWGNKTGSRISPAHRIRLKDNKKNNETAITDSSKEVPSSSGSKGE